MSGKCAWLCRRNPWLTRNGLSAETYSASGLFGLCLRRRGVYRRQPSMPLPIEHYALIGDCHTAALVGRDGSIDWLCLPRFDSAACFAALLGGPEHGRWLIAPADPSHRVERRYLNGSLILVTMFETAGGAVELVDFIGLRHGFSDIVRLVRGLRGRVSMQTEFILR